VSKLTLNPQEVNCNHYICRKCETNVFPTWGWVVYRLPLRWCLCCLLAYGRPLLPSRLWQASADCSLMPLLHFCWWYPLMPLLPSCLWQATADCLLMPLLHFRWWLSTAAFLLLSLCCLSTRGVFHCIACLSADASAAFPLMASRCCLSPAKPLLP
jgi:hypothetical protein